jgi:hypothetical protein
MMSPLASAKLKPPASQPLPGIRPGIEKQPIVREDEAAGIADGGRANEAIERVDAAGSRRAYQQIRPPDLGYDVGGLEAGGPIGGNVAHGHERLVYGLAARVEVPNTVPLIDRMPPCCSCCRK